MNPPSGRAEESISQVIVRRGRTPCHTYARGTLIVCLPAVPATPRDLVQALSCRGRPGGSILWTLLAVLATIAQALISGHASLIVVSMILLAGVVLEVLMRGRRQRNFDCSDRIYPEWVLEALRRVYSLIITCGQNKGCRGVLEVAERRFEYRVPSGLQKRLSGLLVVLRLLEDYS